MLYTETAPELKPVSDLLAEFGVSEELIGTALEYIRSGDDTLLDGLTPDLISLPQKGVTGQMTTRRMQAVTSFGRLMDKKKNREFYLRYIRFCAAAAGLDCYKLIYTSAYLWHGAVSDDSVTTALKARPDIDADAFTLAMNMIFLAEDNNQLQGFKPDHPEAFMNALAMLDSYGKSGCLSAAAALCTFALDNTPLPADGAAPAEQTLAACKRLLEIYEERQKLPAEKYPLLAVGLSEAAYFCPDALPALESLLKTGITAPASYCAGLHITHFRVFDMIERFPALMKPDYIRLIALSNSAANDGKRTSRLEGLAKAHPKEFRIVLDSMKNPAAALRLAKILDRCDSDFSMEEYDLRGREQRRIIKEISPMVRDGGALSDFLGGRSGFKEVYPAVSECNIKYNGRVTESTNYYTLFGADDFMKRLFTVLMIGENIAFYFSNRVWQYTGFDPMEGTQLVTDKDTSPPEERSVRFMLESGAPMTVVFAQMGLAVDSSPDRFADIHIKRTAEAAAKYPDLLADCNPKAMCVTGRVIYANALASDTARFGKQLMNLADDSSKVVRQALVGIFTAADGLYEEIGELLKAKKQSKRELALTVIEARGNENFTEQLQAAFSAEKVEKLSLRIASLIGAEVTASAAKPDTADRMKKIMRGASKLGWLYTAPFKPVHRTDGSEAEEDYLKAIMLCYAGMDKPARNQFASDLAAVLDPKDLEAFAAEVFTRWYNTGAQAKTKWVLFFCSVHGGAPMVRRLTDHIREWGTYGINMRTSIAGDAVKALAMNGSSEALMIVDGIARKFKSKSVRAAANDAMAAAADGLGITAEELADRIVPDLGFDDDLCRVFDYGKRQFRVYIRPSLEPEIFSGDKQLKSMPKPGSTDDPEKAPAAYEQFKEMKKLMRTAVSAQKQRLEYVLMCDRKWTTEGWRALFVKNAVMHCFAIGLIWGIYENGSLKTTFRYMEDGSFTTSDSGEFELPDGAVIGLVHPVELSDELKAEWTEQLSDFGITQPFPQLSRRIFAPTDAEKTQRTITRFDGTETGCLSLVGKMTRFGWYKGVAEDGGIFYYFTREDVSSRFTDADGNTSVTGYGAMLIHSGTYISTYDMDEEELTVGELIFFKAGSAPDHYDKKQRGFLTAAEVSPRYFSEIMMQLAAVFGTTGT